MQAWIIATQGKSESDAQTLCVPAIMVAASFTYDVAEECPSKFSLKVDTPGESGILKGLWQVICTLPPQELCVGGCVEGCD